MSIIRQPRDVVQSVVVHNEIDSEQRWVGQRVGRGSWVNLSATTRGPWAERNRGPGANGNSMTGAWKAQVVDFRFQSSNGPRCPTTAKPILDAVLVRHAFTRRQMYLDPQHHNVTACPCNYLYPSYCEDWVSPKSIVTVIVAHHYEIGKEMQGEHTHSDLRDNDIYFYRYTYVPPTIGELWSTLEDILLPNLDDIDWPLPDMNTSESFRVKLRSDFWRITKATTSSRMGHLQLFIPIHVFVDLISVSKSVRRTRTLLKVVSLEDELFESLMDLGWDEKIHAGRDIIKCKVLRPFVQIRYHIGRQTIYINFKYQRFRLMGGVTWELMDQDANEELIKVDCYCNGELIGRFTVGTTWPLSHIRHEVSITMGEATPEDFKFWLRHPGVPDQKINRRIEKVIEAGIVAHPASLNIVPLVSL